MWLFALDALTFVPLSLNSFTFLARDSLALLALSLRTVTPLSLRRDSRAGGCDGVIRKTLPLGFGGASSSHLSRERRDGAEDQALRLGVGTGSSGERLFDALGASGRAANLVRWSSAQFQVVGQRVARLGIQLAAPGIEESLGSRPVDTNATTTEVRLGELAACGTRTLATREKIELRRPTGISRFPRAARHAFTAKPGHLSEVAEGLCAAHLDQRRHKDCANEQPTRHRSTPAPISPSAR
ncbi:MAG: hypothetical protein U0353_07740 [Sandaracinus sp.]